ncbi:MAG: hypothetical protein Q8N47_11290 [Bryobacterales bacterium]|nr:hypothetical protein [Bryobacterales bacterium]
MFASPDKKAVPLTRFIDVGAMLQDMDHLSRKAGAARIKLFSILSGLRFFSRQTGKGTRSSRLSF